MQRRYYIFYKIQGKCCNFANLTNLKIFVKLQNPFVKLVTL